MLMLQIFYQKTAQDSDFAVPHFVWELDPMHECAQVADAMKVEYTVVEEQLIGDERFDIIDNFFAANGTKKLMFYFQV